MDKRNFSFNSTDKFYSNSNEGTLKLNSAKLNIPENIEKKGTEEYDLNDQLNSNKRTEEGSPLKNLLHKLGTKSSQIKDEAENQIHLVGDYKSNTNTQVKPNEFTLNKDQNNKLNNDSIKKPNNDKKSN